MTFTPCGVWSLRNHGHMSKCVTFMKSVGMEGTWSLTVLCPLMSELSHGQEGLVASQNGKERFESRGRVLVTVLLFCIAGGQEFVISHRLENESVAEFGVKAKIPSVLITRYTPSSA